MAFDQSLINDVLHHADIVDIISRYIDVIQKGREYVALCTFHDDRNPSMQISKTKQIFKCFVCGSGGNAIKFVEMYEHLNFFDAMRKVAQLSGYSDPRLEIKSNVKAKDPQIVNLENCINDLNVYYQYALNTSEGQEPSMIIFAKNSKLDMPLKMVLARVNTFNQKVIRYVALN